MRNEANVFAWLGLIFFSSNYRTFNCWHNSNNNGN